MARTKGATNKPADQIVRRDVLKVYKALGGARWLLEFAKENPASFVQQALVKCLVPPQAAKGTETGQPAPTGELSTFEAARRVAFLLASAAHEAGEPLTIEGEVVGPVPSWIPPADQGDVAVEQAQLGAVEGQLALPAPEPEPVPEDRPVRRSLADLLGVEPPPAVEPSLYSGFGQFHGSAEEQGGGRRDDVRVVQRRQTVVEKLRRQRGG